MLSPKLKAEIRKLWDAFWAGGIANPLTAIEQITYLVFLKRLEDLDNERAKEAQRVNRDYQSNFDTDYTLPDGKTYTGNQFRWSTLQNRAGDDLFNFMRGPVFDWLKTIEKRDDPKADRMRDAVFVIPKVTLLERAMQIIGDLFVPERNQDTLGDIYEMLLSEISEAGKNGQFRTPRHIIRAMCELVDPRPGDRICDPACGTAGFLVNTYQHILANHTSNETLEFNADGSPIHASGDKLSPGDLEELRRGVIKDDQLGHHFFYGFDFDRTMLRLGWMNMIQHGLENPQIYYADTLGSRFNHRVAPGGDLHESFDVVLANPPFAGSIDKSNIGESLRELGTTKTELLFLELTLQLLKLGGRAAVIVPEGVLFGSTRAHTALRRKLVEENRLTAVISLPSGVFQPYSGAKTSILVFYKGGRTEEVWFYEVAADGYNLDARRTERPEENDLWDTVIQYHLRYPELFRRSGKITAPAFVQGGWWSQWSVQSEREALQTIYFRPCFVVDRRKAEEDYSVFAEPEKLQQAIQQARRQVVTTAKAELEAIPKVAQEAALSHLQRRLNTLKREHEGEQRHKALLEVRSELDQISREHLTDALDQIRKQFEKAAEEAGVRTSGDELYGLEALGYALDEALSAFNVDATVTDIMSTLRKKLDRYIEAVSSDQEPLPLVHSPNSKTKEAVTLAKRVKLVRPFAQLDGYARLMFGRILLLTETLYEAIREHEKKAKGMPSQLPDLPKWWTATSEGMLENDHNLSADRYKPFMLEAIEYDPPSQIIDELQKLELQIQEGLTTLLAIIEDVE
jgi:type I restriction enzyme M protein